MITARAMSRALMVYGLLTAAAAAFAGPVGPIRYDVRVTDPGSHTFRIAVTVPMAPSGAGKNHVSLAIPAWTPGYYQILNYQKDISNFRAIDDKGKSLQIARPNDQTWSVMGATGSIYASYDVAANDAGFGFFGSHLDEKTGYINGASAFMYVVDGKQLPATVSFHLPEKWKLATSLGPVQNSRETVPTFRAGDYDEMIDCPMQMGEFERLDFVVKGTPFAAILVGADKVDRPGLTDMLKRVSEAGIELFGYAPFKQYLYIIHFATGSFGGGLEHRNSTVLNVWKQAGENPQSITDLAAHEFFHAFNVKRLRPAVLGPFDYTQKVRTGALWFAEGVTDYYGNVLPLIAGLTTEEVFRADMADRIRQLQHNDARKRVSLEEASQKAWEGGSIGYAGLSYYLKGSLIGLLLDVKIRAATDNAKSLDDVIRSLDARYGKKNVGYGEEALLDTVNEVAGQDLSDFYNRYVRSSEEIPWNSILREAGLVFEEGANKVAYLGVNTEPRKDTLTIIKVLADTAAEKAGLKDSDRIVTLNGARVVPESFQGAIAKLRPGQRITLGIRRGDTAMELPVTLGDREERYTRLRKLDDVDDKTRRVRAGLLRDREAVTAR